MSGATRRSLPTCEYRVQKYNSDRTHKCFADCGKPSKAVWYWREVSDEPKYFCAVHDAKLVKDELKDELEREEEDAKSSVQ